MARFVEGYSRINVLQQIKEFLYVQVSSFVWVELIENLLRIQISSLHNLLHIPKDLFSCLIENYF